MRPQKEGGATKNLPKSKFIRRRILYAGNRKKTTKGSFDEPVRTVDEFL